MAKRKFRTYEFHPTNPEKYQGQVIPIILRSSWELEFAQHCDILPSVLSWGYELIKIPYTDPTRMTVNGKPKQSIYIPDFFVTVAGKDGYSQDYLFEIKPMHEQMQEHARNRADSLQVARNKAKWHAASQWADRHSAMFEILNERDIYGWHETRKPRQRQIKTYSHTHSTTKSKSRGKPTTSLMSKTAKPKRSSKRMTEVRARVSKARSVSKAPKSRRARA